MRIGKRPRLAAGGLARPVEDESDPDALAEIRRVAMRWPDDRDVELTLARAEFAYGDIAAGEAIVTRWLERNGGDVEFLLAAGLGQLRASTREGQDWVVRYQAARPYLVKAYGLAPNDYRILLAYAKSRSAEPGYPNDNDLNALLAARQLAPQVATISLMAGEALLKHGHRPQALAILSALTNDPHGGAAAARAHTLLEANGQAEAGR